MKQLVNVKAVLLEPTVIQRMLILALPVQQDIPPPRQEADKDQSEQVINSYLIVFTNKKPTKLQKNVLSRKEQDVNHNLCLW